MITTKSSLDVRYHFQIVPELSSGHAILIRYLGDFNESLDLGKEPALTLGIGQCDRQQQNYNTHLYPHGGRERESTNQELDRNKYKDNITRVKVFHEFFTGFFEISQAECSWLSSSCSELLKVVLQDSLTALVVERTNSSQVGE